MSLLTVSSSEKATTARLSELFTFLTDLRNIAALIPSEKAHNISCTSDSCRFDITGLGTVEVSLDSSEPFHTVVYKGSAAKKHELELKITLSGEAGSTGSCSVSMSTKLNPFIASMAKKPLQKVAEEMNLRLAGLDPLKPV